MFKKVIENFLFFMSRIVPVKNESGQLSQKL